MDDQGRNKTERVRVKKSEAKENSAIGREKGKNKE